MNMKMKMLTAAVTAALGAGSAHAVNVSQDGLGQAMIMPYYTVQADNEGLISITNATDQVKAVKVRFREAQNSAEVLDFNLYLSPYDVWTAKITDADDGEGAKIITFDTSCTVPMIPAEGAPFRNFVYAGTGSFTGDAGDHGMGRTSEGYVEVIEMGVVIEGSNSAKAATHAANRVPVNCQYLVDNWSRRLSGGSQGRWITDASIDMSSPEGGLFAEANVINVMAGVEASQPVTVLDNFYRGISNLHAEPGSGLPTLGNAEPKESIVFLSGSGAVEIDEWNTGIDAVSAVLMASSIMNGYSVNPVVGSSTEWIINFPTKHFYTSPVPALEPFTNNFEANRGADGTPPGPGAAWEAVTAEYWDREEMQSGVLPPDAIPPEGPDFSPTLPPCEPGLDPECTPDVLQPWALPYEVNVVSFNTVNHNSNFINSAWAKVDFGLNDPTGTYAFNNGWAKINLGPAFDSSGKQVTSDRELVSNSGNVFTGLPVVGFMATILTNENVGVGAAYASTAEHRYMRSISSSK